MRRIRIDRFGGPEVMRYEEVAMPAPGQGEVLVKVAAAGVNFADVYTRVGIYKNAVPLTLGTEGAGTVEAVGAGVADLKVGDRVAWSNVLGSYADYLVAPAERLVPVPTGVSFEQAAAAMLQGMTAHYLAISAYAIKQRDACLVHAAAGGLGGLLCQIAKMKGARVIGTVGSQEKVQVAREAGADEVILYRERDFAAETRRATDGKGVQVVYDMVGKDTFMGSLDCLAPRGMMVLVGQASGPAPSIDPMELNRRHSIYLARPSLRDYTATRDELLWRASDVLGWVADGKLKLTIGGKFPLAEAAESHTALEGRGTVGKLLLVP